MLADATVKVRDTGELPNIYYMATLSFGVAMLAGALRQLEIFSGGEKQNYSSIVCACLFSGIAGFVAYTFSREYISDPLKLVVEALLAGLVGAELVKRIAKEWAAKFKGPE